MKIISFHQWPIESHSSVKAFQVVRTRNDLSLPCHPVSLTLRCSHNTHMLSEINIICGSVMYSYCRNSLGVQSGAPRLAFWDQSDWRNSYSSYKFWISNYTQCPRELFIFALLAKFYFLFLRKSTQRKRDFPELFKPQGMLPLAA